MRLKQVHSVHILIELLCSELTDFLFLEVKMFKLTFSYLAIDFFLSNEEIFNLKM